MSESEKLKSFVTQSMRIQSLLHSPKTILLKQPKIQSNSIIYILYILYIYIIGYH